MIQTWVKNTNTCRSNVKTTSIVYVIYLLLLLFHAFVLLSSYYYCLLNMHNHTTKLRWIKPCSLPNKWKNMPMITEKILWLVLINEMDATHSWLYCWYIVISRCWSDDWQLYGACVVSNQVKTSCSNTK